MRDALIPALQVLTPQRVGSPIDLHIGVVFTDFENTRVALKAAASLSTGLEADIDFAARRNVFDVVGVATGDPLVVRPYPSI